LQTSARVTAPEGLLQPINGQQDKTRPESDSEQTTSETVESKRVLDSEETSSNEVVESVRVRASKKRELQSTNKQPSRYETGKPLKEREEEEKEITR